MISEKQIEANRNNSKLSTGPRNTNNSKRNSLKHGIFSKDLMLTGFYEIENLGELSKLKEELYEEYSPKGLTQEIIVERIFICVWKLKRIEKVKTFKIKQSIRNQEEEIEKEFFEKDVDSVVEEIYRYGSNLTSPRSAGYFKELALYYAKEVRNGKERLNLSELEDLKREVKENLNKYFVHQNKICEEAIERQNGVLFNEDIALLEEYAIKTENQMCKLINTLKNLKRDK